ncbi:nucleotide-binding alpha-beta plait domain-containing protein [Tanacetum coccineum]
MGFFCTKEDDVSRISTSIFVSNFPDSFTAKDLFHSCKQYGHVIDSFIPTKRTKDGKRFGFVRFINVFNVERLVNILCTIWVGRLKLHANVAKFNRDKVKNNTNIDKTDKVPKKSSHNASYNVDGNWGNDKSFVNVVKGSSLSLEMESTPSIVLDDECLNTKDLSCSLMGRVKEFASLSNLKKVLCNKGFDVLKISYLGELWVLLEFESAKVKDLFKENGGANSWFSVLNQASEDFAPGGRIVWVEVEGIPFKFWSGHTFKRIASKWGKLETVFDESNVEEVLETVFDVPEDKNVREHETNEEESSLKHPPGFTPDLNEGQADGGGAKLVNEKVAEDVNSFVHTVSDKANSGSVNTMSGSMGSCRLKKSGRPCSGGSILSVMEKIIKVGHTMGYNMDGCVKDITEIIKSQGEVGVNR